MMRAGAAIALAALGCASESSSMPPPSTDAVADAWTDDGIASPSDATTETCAPPAAPRLPTIVPCDGATCLAVDDLKVKLADGEDKCVGTIYGVRVRDLGGKFAVAHCPPSGVRLSIVDGKSVVAHANAPAGQKNAWTDVLDGRAPFLASSYGDAVPVDPTYGSGATWGGGCVYDPVRTDLAKCGPGFAWFAVAPPGNFFREAGGYSIDLDNDGREDPTFIFHQQVLSVSGKTGAVLSRFEYDVAAATEPSSPKWFHSGRNYGSHSAFVMGGNVRVVEIGATPVGSFADYNCNVSRFLAVLDSPRTAPAWRLAWSRYLGFASTIFSKYEEAYASDPSVVIARRGDFVDKCIHRFSDGRTTIDGTPSIAYNIFHAKSWSTCLKEQYALYIGSDAWSPAKQKAWGDCQVANLKARGYWAMEAVNEATGASVTGGVNNYVWGWSSKLTPSGEALYLVERLPAEHAFDLSDVPKTKLKVLALVKGLWTPRGELSVAGRPKLAMTPPSGPRGMGAYSAYAELSIADTDCDGVPEIELEDGARATIKN